jgi:hypothetical protein
MQYAKLHSKTQPAKTLDNAFSFSFIVAQHQDSRCDLCRYRRGYYLLSLLSPVPAVALPLALLLLAHAHCSASTVPVKHPVSRQLLHSGAPEIVLSGVIALDHRARLLPEMAARLFLQRLSGYGCADGGVGRRKLRG